MVNKQLSVVIRNEIDTSGILHFQKGISADEFHMTKSRAQVYNSLK